MREVAIGRALGNSFKGKHTFGKEGTFQKTHEGGQVKDSRRDLILGHSSSGSAHENGGSRFREKLGGCLFKKFRQNWPHALVWPRKGFVCGRPHCSQRAVFLPYPSLVIIRMVLLMSMSSGGFFFLRGVGRTFGSAATKFSSGSSTPSSQ